MACIYILFSKKINKFYIGSSREENPTERLNSHNSGKTRSTKYGRPWIIVHEEKLENYTEARKKEIFLKSGVGRDWVNKKLGYLKK